MFKMFVTLLRGGVAEAGDAIADRNALLILDQQVRDTTAAFERAKKALAVAIAQDQQETSRLVTTRARIGDLEGRVAAALEAGDEVLAREGAEAIAALEADRDAASAAQTLFAAEILRLRRHVGQAQTRIGRKITAASAGCHRDFADDAGPDLAPFFVLATLAVLNIRPFTVSCHGKYLKISLRYRIDCTF